MNNPNTQNTKNIISTNNELEEARETLEILYEISQILDCGLDRQTLSILVSLCENGVDPKALATVVQELRKESLALRARTDKQPYYTVTLNLNQLSSLRSNIGLFVLFDIYP